MQSPIDINVLRFSLAYSLDGLVECNQNSVRKNVVIKRLCRSYSILVFNRPQRPNVAPHTAVQKKRSYFGPGPTSIVKHEGGSMRCQRVKLSLMNAVNTCDVA